MLEHLKIKLYKGFTLVEVLVAMALLGICISGLFSLLTPSTNLLLNTNLQETARNLATAQLEYIKNLDYDDSNNPPVYAPKDLLLEYPGLSVEVTATREHPIGSSETDDEGVQKIFITVKQNGKILTTLEGYKADW